MINALDPVDNLVGYTWVRFLTSLPVLLVIKSLHFNPIKGVGRFTIRSKLEPGIEVDARGTFKCNLLVVVFTYTTSTFWSNGFPVITFAPT